MADVIPMFPRNKKLPSMVQKKNTTREEAVERLGTCVGLINVERALAFRRLNEEMERIKRQYARDVANYEHSLISLLIDAGFDPDKAQSLKTLDQVFVDVQGQVWIVDNEKLTEFLKIRETEE